MGIRRSPLRNCWVTKTEAPGNGRLSTTEVRSYENHEEHNLRCSRRAHSETLRRYRKYSAREYIRGSSERRGTHGFGVYFFAEKLGRMGIVLAGRNALPMDRRLRMLTARSGADTARMGKCRNELKYQRPGNGTFFFYFSY